MKKPTKIKSKKSRDLFIIIALVSLTSFMGSCGSRSGNTSESNISENYHISDLEKVELKFGFIKLTDMAPLAIAKELGFFEDEGLYVTLEAQSNWKVLLDRVITGEL